jgi:lysophospholipase L1-like esterase
LTSTISSSPATSITKTRTLSKLSELAIGLSIAVISSLMVIGLLEGAAYIWERGQANGLYAWELVASRRLVWEKFPEPGAGYTLMKPGSHYVWLGIPVDINSHGLRTPETTYVKSPGVFRILNLGDSTVMGWGVRQEDTYGQRLEQFLNQQNAGDRHYEVINAGVPGWNLENEQAYLQAEGLKYQPDLIMLEVTIANDINGKSALLARGRPGPIEWLRAHTYFWPFLTVQMRWIEARAGGHRRIDEIDPPTDPSKYFPLDPQAERWTEIWEHVSAIKQLAEENHAQFMLVLFPLEFQVLDANYPTLAQKILTAKAAEDGIPLVEVLPAFQKACQQKPGGVCQLEDHYLFADVWMHPSAYGHQLVATEIERELGELLPNK